MKITPILALAAVFTLTACGGSSDRDTRPELPVPPEVNTASYCEPTDDMSPGDWPGLIAAGSNAPRSVAFEWMAADGASHYRVLENPDGASGFEAVSEDLDSPGFNHPVSVHLHDWHNASYMVDALDEDGEVLGSSEEVTAERAMLDAIGYLKPDDTDDFFRFGSAVAVSADGTTMAIGAPGRPTFRPAEDVDDDPEPEDDNGDGEEPPEEDPNLDDLDEANGEDEGELVRVPNVGAVYVFRMTDNGWVQQALLEADNANAQHRFGSSISLSEDGNTIAVGAWRETSASLGINSESTHSVYAAGAAYVFEFEEDEWHQDAYIKPAFSHGSMRFGYRVALSQDGTRLAVSAPGDANQATGVDPEEEPSGNQPNVGGIFVFDKSDDWEQAAYLKASNAQPGDQFGFGLALSADGRTLVAGANLEASNATSINGDQDNNSAPNAGAAYVFVDNDGWAQQAYLKPSNGRPFFFFGSSTALSADGDTLVVSATGDRNSGSGINDATPEDQSAPNAGAAYVFTRSSGEWSQQTYIKSSNTAEGQEFGSRISMSADGQWLAVSAVRERGIGCGVDADQDALEGTNTGAVYLFSRADDSWEQYRYIKSPTTRNGQRFGHAVAFSADGSLMAVGVEREGSSATGINGDRFDSSLRQSSGAVFLY
ncbi:FG-GAP repeat protein [Marinimicrobium alkaliphilum]|uniref:FG-GAP repeat protein n=1 Tax=Marinimicrobium alkaliphilum TaxID=2202654 RepID=UPI000DB918A8|nr:FG-GAP repeat protein [Marinimicrobium alkaliphilum]